MQFERLPDEVIKNAQSETAKYRHLTAKYCMSEYEVPLVGVDIASQGDPVVPWAIQFELPIEEFDYYCSHVPAKGPIQLRGHADKLPFDSESLAFVYSSHLLEDYLDWVPVLTEWVRVLRPNGHLIILVPDKKLWGEAVLNGQPPNNSHKHESEVGEMSKYAKGFGLEIVEDRLTNEFPGDYSILGVFRKVKGGWDYQSQP